MANKDYERIYDGMNNGSYDVPVRTIEKALNVSMEISVKKVKKACSDAGIEFNEFMTYAQERKAEENAKN